ncbi:hypothetical protein [Mesorhizobium sp. WSM3224]|uniref:hypothetical protein n=1 Tax=Mesorhizobium sp. WSM3224 TaxID=1040986 RepID=UPI0018DB0C46|nr:hypothetical protein [Mesorhizobium sp. WSM3224]
MMQLNIGADQADRWRKNLRRARRRHALWFTRSAMIWVLIVAAITIASTLIALKGL